MEDKSEKVWPSGCGRRRDKNSFIAKARQCVPANDSPHMFSATAKTSKMGIIYMLL
jgi:hypothetical protein